MNNTNEGCCLKFLFGRQCVHSRLSERWQRLSKKSPKAVFVAQSTVGKGSSVTDHAGETLGSVNKSETPNMFKY